MGLPIIGAGLGLRALIPMIPRITSGVRKILPRSGSIGGGVGGVSKTSGVGGGAGLPMVIGGGKIGSTIPKVSKGTMAATGLSLGGYGLLGDQFGSIADEAEISIQNEKNQPGGPVNTVPDSVAPKKKPDPKKDGGASGLDDDIKQGKLDDFIKERMDLFDKYLGDTKDQVKSGGFAALTEFGLNLASARGGNLMDKIARSAKDPLKTFTAIGMAAKDRADKIKMAAIESGIEAQEAALDRAGDTEGTTFQKNLTTLKAMFTDPNTKELTIPQEDLINMAKTGATTSRKEFLATVVPNLIKSLNPNTGQTFTPDEATFLAEQTWSRISGEEITSSKKDELDTTTTSDPLGVR